MNKFDYSLLIGFIAIVLIALFFIAPVSSDIACSQDAECNDGNPRTFDECINPGTGAAFCRNTEVNCLTEQDCGIDGFVGSEFCSENGVYKNYLNFTCVNSGALDSHCISESLPKLVTE